MSKKLDIVVAIFIAGLLAFTFGVQTGYSWTGNWNTISDGYIEIEQVNATQYYWNDANRTILLSGQNATGATAYVGFDSNLEYLPNYWLCDGTEDDVQIQSAINYTGGFGGGTVHISPLVDIDYYDITAEVNDGGYDNITLEGEGRHTLLRVADNTNITAIKIDGRTGWIIRDLAIDGNYANNAEAGDIFDQNGVMLTGVCYDVTIENLHVTDTRDNGILVGDGDVKVAGPQRVKVFGCTITGTQRDGFLARGAIYLTIQGNQVYNIVRHGIMTVGSQYVDIVDNVVWGCDLDPICMYNCDYGTISSNVCNDAQNNGIVLARSAATLQDGPSTYITIIGNIVNNSRGTSGIYAGASSGAIFDHILITDNVVQGNATSGIILIYAEYSAIIGNIVEGAFTRGIECHYSKESTVSDNTVRNAVGEGIYILTSANTIISDNKAIQNGGDGIEVRSTSEGCAITGNIAQNNTGNGIYLVWYVDDSIISDNECRDNGVDGIKIETDTDRCLVTNNIVRTNTGYGINIASADCANNVVIHNVYSGNANPINDIGTKTRLQTYSMQFIDGTAFNSTAGDAWGWEIDANTEYAVTVGWLPLELKNIVRIRVIAVGLSAPGASNSMRLEITGESGTFNESYTQMAIDVINKNSEQINFAVNDVIEWVYTSTDDAQIGVLFGGDLVQFKVLHEAAGDGDIATDAVFISMEIEYV